MVVRFFGVGERGRAGAVVEGEGAGEGEGVADVNISYTRSFNGEGAFEVEGFVAGS